MVSPELLVDTRRLCAQDPRTFEKAIESVKKNGRLDIITQAADDILAIARGEKI